MIANQGVHYTNIYLFGLVTVSISSDLSITILQIFRLLPVELKLCVCEPFLTQS